MFRLKGKWRGIPVLGQNHLCGPGLFSARRSGGGSKGQACTRGALGLTPPRTRRLGVPTRTSAETLVGMSVRGYRTSQRLCPRVAGPGCRGASGLWWLQPDKVRTIPGQTFP